MADAAEWTGSSAPTAARPEASAGGDPDGLLGTAEVAALLGYGSPASFSSALCQGPIPKLPEPDTLQKEGGTCGPNHKKWRASHRLTAACTRGHSAGRPGIPGFRGNLHAPPEAAGKPFPPAKRPSTGPTPQSVHSSSRPRPPSKPAGFCAGSGARPPASPASSRRSSPCIRPAQSEGGKGSRSDHLTEAPSTSPFGSLRTQARASSPAPLPCGHDGGMSSSPQRPAPTPRGLSDATAEDLALYREKFQQRLPQSLDELHGPTRGVVELPLHMAWSGMTSYDMAKPRQCMGLYRTVLHEGLRDDLPRCLNQKLLLQLWPVLRTLVGRTVRTVWEDAFPQLASHARAAA